jgi:hypothetical protein
VNGGGIVWKKASCQGRLMTARQEEEDIACGHHDGYPV